ncbi:glutathione S-transferase [Saccharobesus litoralis]|uniref:Glutathione S-transferase n=1 Tax=Saccharobesus litoralis TaxID=2172099 RepID=A0A2S0VND6_9ALTE|nr:glutathione S-transferase family protein [Saccharobesus litoralis]AWB65716.1 glutathione S-transferase [Saccharobesus litoralis]
MTDLNFYTSPNSRGSIVRWLLEELGVPYQTTVMASGTTRQDAEFLTINPMGKVPALVHGDVVVTEAAAICLYLADIFPDVGLAPKPSNRGDYYRWLLFAAGPLEAAMTNNMLGVTVPDELSQSIGYGSYARVLDTLENALAGKDYLAGNKFSALDVYMGSQIGMGMLFGLIEKRPAFEAYWQRLIQRPAYIRAQELDARIDTDS